MDQADTELVQERTKIPVENVDESQVKDVEAKLDAVELAKEDDTTKDIVNDKKSTEAKETLTEVPLVEDFVHETIRAAEASNDAESVEAIRHSLDEGIVPNPDENATKPVIVSDTSGLSAQKEAHVHPSGLNDSSAETVSDKEPASSMLDIPSSLAIPKDVEGAQRPEQVISDPVTKEPESAIAPVDEAEPAESHPSVEEATQPSAQPTSSKLQDNEDQSIAPSHEAATPATAPIDEHSLPSKVDNHAEHSSSAPAEETSPDSEMGVTEKVLVDVHDNAPKVEEEVEKKAEGGEAGETTVENAETVKAADAVPAAEVTEKAAEVETEDKGGDASAAADSTKENKASELSVELTTDGQKKLGDTTNATDVKALAEEGPSESKETQVDSAQEEVNAVSKDSHVEPKAAETVSQAAGEAAQHIEEAPSTTPGDVASHSGLAAPELKDVVEQGSDDVQSGETVVEATQSVKEVVSATTEKVDQAVTGAKDSDEVVGATEASAATTVAVEEAVPAESKEQHESASEHQKEEHGDATNTAVAKSIVEESPNSQDDQSTSAKHTIAAQDSVETQDEPEHEETVTQVSVVEAQVSEPTVDAAPQGTDVEESKTVSVEGAPQVDSVTNEEQQTEDLQKEQTVVEDATAKDDASAETHANFSEVEPPAVITVASQAAPQSLEGAHAIVDSRAEATLEPAPTQDGETGTASDAPAAVKGAEEQPKEEDVEPSNEETSADNNPKHPEDDAAPGEKGEPEKSELAITSSDAVAAERQEQAEELDEAPKQDVLSAVEELEETSQGLEKGEAEAIVADAVHSAVESAQQEEPTTEPNAGLLTEKHESTDGKLVEQSAETPVDEEQLAEIAETQESAESEKDEAKKSEQDGPESAVAPHAKDDIEEAPLKESEVANLQDALQGLEREEAATVVDAAVASVADTADAPESSTSPVPDAEIKSTVVDDVEGTGVFSEEEATDATATTDVPILASTDGHAELKPSDKATAAPDAADAAIVEGEALEDAVKESADAKPDEKDLAESAAEGEQLREAVESTKEGAPADVIDKSTPSEAKDGAEDRSTTHVVSEAAAAPVVVAATRGEHEDEDTSEVPDREESGHSAATSAESVATAETPRGVLESVIVEEAESSEVVALEAKGADSLPSSSEAGSAESVTSIVDAVDALEKSTDAKEVTSPANDSVEGVSEEAAASDDLTSGATFEPVNHANIENSAEKAPEHDAGAVEGATVVNPPSPEVERAPAPDQDRTDVILEHATAKTEYSENSTAETHSHSEVSDAPSEAESITTVMTAKPSDERDEVRTVVEDDRGSDVATAVQEGAETSTSEGVSGGLPDAETGSISQQPSDGSLANEVQPQAQSQVELAEDNVDGEAGLAQHGEQLLVVVDHAAKVSPDNTEINELRSLNNSEHIPSHPVQEEIRSSLETEAASEVVTSNNREEDISDESTQGRNASQMEITAEEAPSVPVATEEHAPSQTAKPVDLPEETPEETLVFEGPSAHTVDVMDEHADAASAQGEDVDANADSDDEPMKDSTQGAEATPPDDSKRPKSISGGVDEDESVGKAVGQQTPTVLVTGPDDIGSEPDASQVTHAGAEQTAPHIPISFTKDEQPQDFSEPAQQESDHTTSEAVHIANQGTNAGNVLQDVAIQEVADRARDETPLDESQRDEDKLEVVVQVNVEVAEPATREEIQPENAQVTAEVQGMTYSGQETMGNDTSIAREVSTATNEQDHSEVPLPVTELPEIVADSTGKIVDEESSTYGKIPTEFSTEIETESDAAVSSQSIPYIEVVSVSTEAFGPMARTDTERSISESADENESTSDSIVQQPLEDVGSEVVENVGNEIETRGDPIMSAPRSASAAVASVEERDNKTRDNRISAITESADGGVTIEPPPPPYDELVIAVDEAVAKAVSSADSKELADEGDFQTREGPKPSLPEQPSNSANWTASYSVTTQGPNSPHQAIAQGVDDLVESSPKIGAARSPRKSPLSLSMELVDDVESRAAPSNEHADIPPTASDAPADIAEEVPRPKSPYPSSYSVTQQGAGFKSGETSPRGDERAAEPVAAVKEDTHPSVVDALQFTPTKKRILESSISPAPVLNLRESQDSEHIHVAIGDHGPLSEQAFAYMHKAIESHNEITPDDSVSDVSASDAPEPSMTPKSDLGIFTPGFDTRSEVSYASRDPIPPTSPRLDPEAPLTLEEPTAIELEKANVTPTAQVSKALLSENALPGDDEQFSLPTPLVKDTVVLEGVPQPTAADVDEPIAEKDENSALAVEAATSKTVEDIPATQPSDKPRSVLIDVQSPSESDNDAQLTYVTDFSTKGDVESEPASSSFDADIDSDYPVSSGFSMVGSESVGGDDIGEERDTTESTPSEPRPVNKRRDTDSSVELVDAPAKSLSDSDGVLVETPPVIGGADPDYAEALEAAADDDVYSVTSGLSESVTQTSGLESITDRSTELGSLDTLDISATITSRLGDAGRSLRLPEQPVIHMSPTIPSEMALSMPTPEIAQAGVAERYVEPEVASIADSGHNTLTSGTATPRQLNVATAFTSRSAGTPPPEDAETQISEPSPEVFTFPSLVVSRETSQSTVETTSSGPSTALMSVPEYGDSDFSPIAPMVRKRLESTAPFPGAYGSGDAEFIPVPPSVGRKRLESTLSMASTRFPGGWVTNTPMVPERPSIDIIAEGEFSRPSSEGATPLSPLQGPLATPSGEESDEERKSRCVIM